MPRKVVENVKRNGRTIRKSCLKKSTAVMEDGCFSDSTSSVIGSTAQKESSGIKRKMDDYDDDLSVANDLGSEMTKLLQGFSSKINESIQHKRQRVKKYTEESTQVTAKKVLETCKTQSIERRCVMEEFRKQIVNVLDSVEHNMDKERESFEKAQRATILQQKHLVQNLDDTKQHFQAMNEMAAQFFKGMDDLELRHEEQYARVHNDLRKEMLQLQKKILQETQQQQLMQVRKNLQSMFG